MSHVGVQAVNVVFLLDPCWLSDLVIELFVQEGGHVFNQVVSRRLSEAKLLDDEIHL